MAPFYTHQTQGFTLGYPLSPLQGWLTNCRLLGTGLLSELQPVEQLGVDAAEVFLHQRDGGFICGSQPNDRSRTRWNSSLPS